jgi:ABC-2 type transport system ATP-binding protein
LGEVQKRLIANLSRGYRQRVGLAQALIHDPEVLILDEPTTGLDPKQIIEIRDLIKSLRGEHTLILSTHILPEATAVCQKVVIINRGQIVAVGSPEQLSSQMCQSERFTLTVRQRDRFNAEKILALPGVRRITEEAGREGSFLVETLLGADVRENVAQIVVQEGWGLLEMKPLTVGLEEVFLHLTTEEKGVEAAA